MSEITNRLAVRIFQTARNIPVEAQTVIALRAFGMEPEQIAQQLGFVDSVGVERLLEQYDPDKNAEKGDALRKLVLSCMFERIGLEVLTRIKPKDIDKLDVAKKIEVAERCVRAVHKLNAKPVPLEPDEESLIESLKESEA